MYIDLLCICEDLMEGKINYNYNYNYNYTWHYSSWFVMCVCVGVCVCVCVCVSWNCCKNMIQFWMLCFKSCCKGDLPKDKSHAPTISRYNSTCARIVLLSISLITYYVFLLFVVVVVVVVFVFVFIYIRVVTSCNNGLVQICTSRIQSN